MNNYSSVRVGVAGATGYAGLELLRRLARHPHADVRYAMASSAFGIEATAGAGANLGRTGRAARRRKAWRLKRTRCFSHCPIRSPPKSHRSWPIAARACSISQAHSGCAMPRCASGGIRTPARTSVTDCLRADRTAATRARECATRSRVPGVTRPPRCSRCNRSSRRRSSSPGSSSTRNRVCRARARRRPSARIFPSATAASRPTAYSRIVMPPKLNRSSERR